MKKMKFGKIAWVFVIACFLTADAAETNQLSNCLFWSPQTGTSPQKAIKAYLDLRIRNIPAEFHADTDDAGRTRWSARRSEFARQMNLDGRLGPEQTGLSRFPDDSARAFYEKVPLWEKDRMPDAGLGQCAPYLEWHLPRKRTTRAVMVVFSGGGYDVNSTDGSSVPPVRRYLNARGMAVVTLKYRTPRPKRLAKHVTAWQDLQRAIRLVRAGAERRGLDPRRIGVWGGSAGGHLALLGALSSTRAAYRPVDDTDREPCDVQLAVALFPAYVLSDGVNTVNAAKGNAPDVKIVGEFAFDAKSSPVLFLHGDGDPYSAMGSVRMWERLQSMGVPSAVHTFAKRGHDFQYRGAPGTASYNYLDIAWDYMNQRGFVHEGQQTKGKER